jgi:hypothetical protein
MNRIIHPIMLIRSIRQSRISKLFITGCSSHLCPNCPHPLSSSSSWQFHPGFFDGKSVLNSETRFFPCPHFPHRLSGSTLQQFHLGFLDGKSVLNSETWFSGKNQVSKGIGRNQVFSGKPGFFRALISLIGSVVQLCGSFTLVSWMGNRF